MRSESVGRLVGWRLKLVTAVLNSEGIHLYKWWRPAEVSLINPCNDVKAATVMVLEARWKERENN